MEISWLWGADIWVFFRRKEWPDKGFGFGDERSVEVNSISAFGAGEAGVGESCDLLESPN